MTIVEAIILAIVEGVTEFLPISSTGHLILTSHLLGLQQTEFLKSFEVIIQIGAILAVIVLYFNKLQQFKSLWKPLAAAFLPSAVVGLILYKFIKSYLLGNDQLVAVTLILGGIVLIAIEKIRQSQPNSTDTVEAISIKQSIAIGLGQALSIVPGVSRSGATIVAGLLAGVSRQTAVEFSFLLAVPTMLAATALDLLQSAPSFSSEHYFTVGLGVAVSFITALLAIKSFLGYIQKNSLAIFGYYRIIIGILYLIFIR